jgi:chromosome transmission fidelity protein 4
VDAGKLEAALDLIDRLHLETSYNLAIQLADRHHKLADMIEEAKLRRFADNDDDGYDDEEDGGPSSTFMDRIEEGTEGGKRNISPDSTIVQKKRFRVY